MKPAELSVCLGLHTSMSLQNQLHSHWPPLPLLLSSPIKLLRKMGEMHLLIWALLPLHSHPSHCCACFGHQAHISTQHHLTVIILIMYSYPLFFQSPYPGLLESPSPQGHFPLSRSWMMLLSFLTLVCERLT